MKKNYFMFIIAALCLGMMVASCSESPTEPEAAATATPVPATPTATPTFVAPTAEIKISITGSSASTFVGHGDPWGADVQEAAPVALPWEKTITIGFGQCPAVGGGGYILDGGDAQVTVYKDSVQIGQSTVFTAANQPQTGYRYEIANPHQ